MTDPGPVLVAVLILWLVTLLVVSAVLAWRA